MHVLALQIELRFPASQSLKQKRAHVRPIIDGLRSRFEVSVSEVAHHDTWQRSAIGVAIVGGEVAVVERVGDQIERFVWQADAEVLGIDRHWLDIDH